MPFERQNIFQPPFGLIRMKLISLSSVNVTLLCFTELGLVLFYILILIKKMLPYIFVLSFALSLLLLLKTIKLIDCMRDIMRLSDLITDK